MSTTTAPVGFEPEFRVVVPESIVVENALGEGPVDEVLLASVREMGVLTPPLVVEADDGTLVLVTGRRRLAAALEAGTMLPVRVLRCTLEDAVRAAIHEHYLHRSMRSIIERSWDAHALQQTEIAMGRSGSVRAIARHMSVAVGTAQYLVTIGRELTPDRLSSLAEESGVPAAEIRTLTVKDARRLGACPSNRHGS
ncbi:MAG TPA: ParB N-terminal domain-containing protein [Bryobacteraceae bacterium]|nr:ParB N-terminal domain-containing protein [Bryobacteraceae bacterium]